MPPKAEILTVHAACLFISSVQHVFKVRCRPCTFPNTPELPFLIAGYYLEWQMTGQVSMMILGLLIFMGMCLGAKKILEWNEKKILFKTSLILIILFYSVT